MDEHTSEPGVPRPNILSVPEDAPYGRLYRVEDVEGHRWMFMQAKAA